MGENRSQGHLASKAKSYQVQHIEEQAKLGYVRKNIIDRILFEIDPLYSGQVHHLLHVIHP